MIRERRSDRAERLLRRAGRILLPRLLIGGGLALLALMLLGELRWSPLTRQPVGPPPVSAARDSLVDPAPGPGWPHLRGPYHNATSTEAGLADAWPAEGPPVLWIREIGEGYSGFIAVEQSVFTQRQTLMGQSVLCLDADTGELVWEHRYDWPYEAAGMYPGPRATPVWHAGRIYFAAPDGSIGCLDAGDGRPLWSRNVHQEFGGRGTEFGYSASPTIVDGKVILPLGGPGASVVALDAQDGSTVWACGDEPASYCSALPITLGGRRLIVAFLQNTLAVIDPQPGRLLWQHRFSGGYDERAAMPLYQEPYLLVAHPFRAGADVFEIQMIETPVEGASESRTSREPPPELTAGRVRHIAQMSNDVASSVLVGGRVFGFDLRELQSKSRRPSRGEFRCVELLTGDVLWSTDRSGHCTVIYADGKLILFNDRGELLLVRAAADGYHELARTQVFAGEICWASPALHRGRLYLRSPTRAACIYVGEPTALEADQASHARPASQIPQASRWDWRWLVGGERPYPADFPTRRELVGWYLVVLVGAMIPCLFLAAGVTGLSRRVGADPGLVGPAVFWSGLFVAGIALTPLGNALGDEFVFTWPLSLFVAQHVVLSAIVRAHRERAGDAVPWAVCAATLGFFATCLVYFHFCRRLDLAVGWVFLLGFIPSWPVALPAARKLSKRSGLWVAFVGAVISFSVYYWVVGAYVLLTAS